MRPSFLPVAGPAPLRRPRRPPRLFFVPPQRGEPCCWQRSPPSPTSHSSPVCGIAGVPHSLLFFAPPRPRVGRALLLLAGGGACAASACSPHPCQRQARRLSGGQGVCLASFSSLPRGGSLIVGDGPRRPQLHPGRRFAGEPASHFSLLPLARGTGKAGSLGPRAPPPRGLVPLLRSGSMPGASCDGVASEAHGRRVPSYIFSLCGECAGPIAGHRWRWLATCWSAGARRLLLLSLFS